MLVQSFPAGITLEYIVLKPSPSSFRRLVIEKDGSTYELTFSWDFGMRRKGLRKEESSVLFLKDTSYQNCHGFPKHAQDNLQGNLRSCGHNCCKALSLSASQWDSLWLKVLSQQGCTGLPLFSHSLRGKSFETRWWSSGVRGHGSLRPEAAALQPLLTFFFLPVEPGIIWLYQIKSNHICLVEINNRSVRTMDLLRTLMGVTLKDFSFLELSIWSPGWLILCIHLSPSMHYC